MKLVKERWTEGGKYWRLFFEYKHLKDAGFSFPSDENGVLNFDRIEGMALISLADCLYYKAGEFKAPIVDSYEWSYTHPAVWQCDCGMELECGGFTNECEGCGALYNWAGQRLTDPSNWGEETGEHPADILNCDFDRILDEGADY